MFYKKLKKILGAWAATAGMKGTCNSRRWPVVIRKQLLCNPTTAVSHQIVNESRSLKGLQITALSTIHVSKKFWTSSWAARPCYSSHFHCGRLYLVSNGNISTVKRINLRALWWLVAKNSSPSGSGSLIRWGRQRKFGGGFLFFCF